MLKSEWIRLAIILVLFGLIGAAFDAVLLGLFVAALACCIVQLFYARALLRWMEDPKLYDLPDGEGIWRNIYSQAIKRRKQDKKRKKQLRTIVGEFRASTAALPDAAIVLDSNGCISWFNSAAIHLLQLEPSRDRGIRIVHLLRNPEFSAYLARHQDNAPHDDEQGIELADAGDSGRILWMRVIPYGRGQKLLIARDVTQIKQLEMARRDFVANASHELRTPLTVLSGYLEMMGQDAEAGHASGANTGTLAQWQAPLREMRQQASRMQTIIVDMLKLANLEASPATVEDQLVDMPALIATAMAEASVLSAGQHQLITDVDEQLFLRGQPAELHSIISNLLSNALRYTPAQGSVSIHWQRESGEPDESTGAVLRVCDTGIGIAAADIPRLSERFYRADAARSRETGGTGLGLAIVKHALERHGASMSIHSTVGQGSEFRCQFPAARCAVPANPDLGR